MSKRIVTIVGSGFDGDVNALPLDMNKRYLHLEDTKTGGILRATGQFSDAMELPKYPEKNGVFIKEDLMGAFLLATEGDILDGKINSNIRVHSGYTPAVLQEINSSDIRIMPKKPQLSLVPFVGEKLNR